MLVLHAAQPDAPPDTEGLATLDPGELGVGSTTNKNGDINE